MILDFVSACRKCFQESGQPLVSEYLADSSEFSYTSSNKSCRQQLNFFIKSQNFRLIKVFSQLYCVLNKNYLYKRQKAMIIVFWI